MVTSASSATAIEFRGLSRHFGATRAVDNVSLAIAAGSVCGFVGPNGAGKTTAMRILATLDLPTHGDALIHGMSVVLDADRVRPLVGFMPDSYGVYKNVRCHEYLDFFARAYGLVGRERERRVRQIMEFTGVDQIREKQMTALSKGMRQRLCLGRALIHDPKVLILDEPAAGLDPRARRELKDMVGELAGQGKTLLISSHILAELAEMVTEICIIEQGRLRAHGRVDEIQRHVAPDQTIRVRLLDDPSRLVAWLENKPQILETQRESDHVILRVPQNDDAGNASLLREMIEEGFQIAEFTVQQKSLEDVFMHVTDGVVQ